MLKTIHAIVDQEGRIKLLESADLKPAQRLLVTILENEEESVNGIPITALLSEPALGEYWDRPAEDEAWRDLQSGGEGQQCLD